MPFGTSTQVHDNKAIKGRSYSAIYAACIYVACRQENLPRTFKEIGAVLPDASKKDIGRCFNAIDQMYKAQKLDTSEKKGLAAAAAGPTGQAMGGKAMTPVDVMVGLASNTRMLHGLKCKFILVSPFPTYST